MVIGRKKIYYGWIIVAVGVIMMMSYGIVNNCISLYIVPICSELGFTRKAGAFMSTLYSAGGMLVSAISSSLYRVISVKKSMRISAAVSYTHLDVYKRQRQDGARYSSAPLTHGFSGSSRAARCTSRITPTLPALCCSIYTGWTGTIRC